MSLYDGVAVATHTLLAQMMRMLLAKGVLSVEDIRELLDTAISRLESSSLDIESIRDARKMLEGDLASAFGSASPSGRSGRKRPKLGRR